MSIFLHHFIKHVRPRMLNLAQAEGFCIAHGEETFINAHRIIMDYARKYGALHLPEDALDDLDEWIATALLEAIDRVEGA